MKQLPILRRVTFEKKYASAIQKSENLQQPGVWHCNHEIHKAAFKSMSEIIEEEIIENGRIYFLADLHSIFKSLLIELGDGVYSSENTGHSNASHFADKILESFGDRVIIETSDMPLKKRIVYKMDMNISRLVQEKALRERADATKLEQAAFEIRNSVKKYASEETST